MVDLLGKELKLNQHVKVIRPSAGTFTTYDAVVVGFTPQKVKIKKIPDAWEMKYYEKDPNALMFFQTKKPSYLIIVT